MEESVPALSSESTPGKGGVDSIGKKPKPKSKNNPHKVNQYTEPDPRQSLFLANYFDPKSETFSNALQSALSAGYAQEYAERLTYQMPDWLSEKLADNRHAMMLAKAERNFNQMLDLDTMEIAVIKRKNKKGEVVEKEIKRPDAALLRVKKDVSEFVSETIGKTIYSKQAPKAGGGGARINFFTQINNDKGSFAPGAEEKEEAEA